LDLETVVRTNAGIGASVVIMPPPSRGAALCLEIAAAATKSGAGRSGENLVLLVFEPIAPSIVVVNVETVRRIGLSDCAMHASDCKVLIVVMGRLVTKIVASCDHHAIIGTDQ
jgi:hypothetical protein